LVVTLGEGVSDPAAVVEHYAVTREIHNAYAMCQSGVRQLPLEM
jgi:hypothetical protein